MFKRVIKPLAFLFIVFLVSGCATSKVRVRSYMQDKPRVDQKMEGNAGYLLGAPKDDENVERKMTRKIYVLEFSKAAPPQDGVVDGTGVVKYRRIDDSDENLDVSTQDIRSSDLTQVDLPNSTGSVYVQGSIVEYIVEKSDTLQKISKKFYGKYSAWPKIYEVNKDVIDNPDFVRPGTVLQIPME